jgi:hypothetical protein
MVNLNCSQKVGTIVDIDVGIDIRVRVALVVEEASKKMRESCLVDVRGEFFNCPRIPSFWKMAPV